MEQIFIPKQNYKVLVRCYTYNQAKYIKDALNGFAMQKTDFPFVCLVMDDCSTDGEQEVIKAWMERECDMARAELVELELADMVLVPHRTNENCSFTFYLLKKNLKKTGKKKTLVTPWREHCEYESLCEGDDYWISPTKLQKQVQILDEKENMYLCGSNGIVHYEKLIKQPRYFSPLSESKELLPSDIIGHWVMPTASLMCRTKLLVDYPSWTKNIYSGDQTLILLSLYKGGVYFLSDITCIYRQIGNKNSVSFSARRISRNYITDQHIILYEEYDKYTQGKYGGLVRNHIKALKKRSKVYKIMNYSYLLSFLRDPITFMKIVNGRKKHF